MVLRITYDRQFDHSFINYKEFYLLHLQVSSVPQPSEFQQPGYEFEKVELFFPNVIGAIDGLHL